MNDPTASGGSCVRLPKKGGNIAWEVEVSEAGRYDLKEESVSFQRRSRLGIRMTNGVPLVCPALWKPSIVSAQLTPL